MQHLYHITMVHHLDEKMHLHRHCKHYVTKVATGGEFVGQVLSPMKSKTGVWWLESNNTMVVYSM